LLMVGGRLFALSVCQREWRGTMDNPPRKLMCC
jgi:hypothetical protein